MAAGEDQLEPLAANSLVLQFVHGCLRHLELAFLLLKPALPTDAIDGPVSSGRDQPSDRVVRCPVSRPALGGRGKSFLCGLLGELEVAEEADQGRQYPAPVLPEDGLEQRYRSTREIGRAHV